MSKVNEEFAMLRSQVYVIKQGCTKHCAQLDMIYSTYETETEQCNHCDKECWCSIGYGSYLC